MSVYDFDSYRAYLRERFPAKGAGRGQRKFLAERLRCQVSLVGLVLTERAHFSDEMLCEVAEFLRLTEAEKDFLLLLAAAEKAGSHKLRRLHEARIHKARDENRRVESAIERDKALAPEIVGQYYAHWLHIAVHIAASIPSANSVEGLVRLLHWPREQVVAAVDFLLKHGILKTEGDKLVLGARRLHLKRDDPLIAQLHTTWRLEATRQIQANKPTNLHFSATYSVSQADYERIRKMMEDAIVACEKVVAPSPEEALMVLAVDCWKY